MAKSVLVKKEGHSFAALLRGFFPWALPPWCFCVKIHIKNRKTVRKAGFCMKKHTNSESAGDPRLISCEFSYKNPKMRAETEILYEKTYKTLALITALITHGSALIALGSRSSRMALHKQQSFSRFHVFSYCFRGSMFFLVASTIPPLFFRVISVLPSRLLRVSPAMTLSCFSHHDSSMFLPRFLRISSGLSPGLPQVDDQPTSPPTLSKWRSRWLRCELRRAAKLAPAPLFSPGRRGFQSRTGRLPSRQNSR